MKESNTPTPLRVIYLVIGCLMIVLGIVGAVLPIMPAVPFLLVASWCFARSSPRFHNWLHNHKVFGPPIKQWEEQGVISPFIKFLAVGGMAVGFCSFLLIAQPVLWLALITIAVLILISIYILTRPSR